MPQKSIMFDLIFIPESAGDTVTPIKSERLVRVQRFLASKGITCHPLSYGLACEGSQGQLESLLDVKLIQNTMAPNSPWHFESKPILPKSIQSEIQQLTLTALPELF